VVCSARGRTPRANRPLGPRTALGDRHHEPLRVAFERQLQLESHGSIKPSDAGLLTDRELDDALRLTRMAARPAVRQFPVVEPLGGGIGPRGAKPSR
jgi:hypothetical protein